MIKNKKFILWFNEIGIKDVSVVGGKNASLGEMFQHLTKKGINVPNGFAVTAYAYKYFIKKSGIQQKIKKLLKGINKKDVRTLLDKGRRIRELILEQEIPKELEQEIFKAYEKLSKEYKTGNADVAVRSSATAEDLPEASFAGQQETFLNIKGKHEVIDACRKCFASLFTNRAITYREEKKFDHFSVYLSIGVQKMIRSDLASSGVIFTLDTESGFSNVVFISGSWGLGESVVQGQVNPDEFYVFKPALKKGYAPIIQKVLGTKATKIVYSEEGMEKSIKKIDTPKTEQEIFCLNDKEILTLAKWAVGVEEHYSQKKGKWTPMDLEWAKDGATGDLFIVQARPETVQSQKPRNVIEEYKLAQKGKAIATGKSVGTKIGQGTAHAIKSAKDISLFKEGEVLVTEMTDPDWVVGMKMAKAIVTDKGGRTCFGKNTLILTATGFITIEQAYRKIENQECLSVLSLDSKTGKIIWRNVIGAFCKRDKLLRIQVSPNLRSNQNYINVTEDHKFLTLMNRNIVKKPVKDLLEIEEGILVARKVPSFGNHSLKENEAYLLGAILSDGCFLRNKRGGYVVGFTQKITENKMGFINAVCNTFKSVYSRELKFFPDERYGGGNFNCHSKQIYEQLSEKEENLSSLMLSLDEPNLLRFLAGIIDGDGNISNHQIQITVGDENILRAIIIASYRLGIIPSICKRKNWFVVSYSNNFDQLLTFTKRITKKPIFESSKGKLFFSKQILRDVIHKVDHKGRIKSTYLMRNRLMSEKYIKTNILPRLGKNLQFERLLNSDFAMQRVAFQEFLLEQEVYDLTVDAFEEYDHNYIVFSENYTPLIVSNCHAAIVSRELGIPCVVGTMDGTKKIKTGQKITVSCAEGEEGKVYDGLLKFTIAKKNIENLPKTKTKIMINIGSPEEAFKLSFLPNDGVGLAREEFIITDYIKIHPLALINYAKIKNSDDKKQIDTLTQGYKDKTQFFVDKLAEGVATIVAAFWPNPVIVRTSDFKSNEYANLIGGKEFEPHEENPMIGWRGASRYYKKPYIDAFKLECKALKKVLYEFGLANMKIMIPMVRTPDEGREVINIIEKSGIKRKDAEIYAMCEVPSNVALMDKYCKVFDGFSIGSNDLTQLTLGIDRDSSLIADLYDERNEAVLRMLKWAIEGAKKHKKKIGICGQGPSDHPDLAKFLVKCGIDSISLNPDAVIKTRILVAKCEKKK